MKKRYQFRNVEPKTIETMNKIKEVLRLKNLGEVLTLLTEFYTEKNKKELNEKIKKF